jgi:uncharacterized YigZ family protein
MISDTYKTIKVISTGIYKEKGSKFIATAYPVANTDEIRFFLDNVKKEHHNARHHCYAYMLGFNRETWRINDDGEPPGTAGKPIMGQINSFNITNVLIIVTRYFGGTLLGVSGLINAYKTAANDALSKADIVEQTVKEYYDIFFNYDSMNHVMKILKEEAIEQSDQLFNIKCKISISFRESLHEKIFSRLNRIEGLKYEYLGKW